MKRFMFAVGLLVCSMTGFGQTTATKTFISKEGRFSVRLPSRPTVSLAKPNGDGGGGKWDYTIDNGSSSYLVSFTELPPSVGQVREPEMVLNVMRDNLMINDKGKLLSEKKISFGNYPGRELAIARDAASSMRVRIFVVENREYTAIYRGPNDKVNSEAIASYLDSLKLFKPHTLPETWKRFDTGDGKFTIKMPVTPTLRVGHTSADVETHAWQSTNMQTRMTYIAGSSVLETVPTKPEEIDKILDNCREGALAGIGGKLVEERWLSVDGYRGRELVVKVILNGVAVADALGRFVIVDNRIIQMLAVGPLGTLDKGQVDDYMDSFKLGPMPALTN